jgi:hypothetical protein
VGTFVWTFRVTRSDRLPEMLDFTRMRQVTVQTKPPGLPAACRPCTFHIDETHDNLKDQCVLEMAQCRASLVFRPLGPSHLSRNVNPSTSNHPPNTQQILTPSLLAPFERL